MNDQANKVLGELLQKASDGIDAAVSFSQAQIPDVVHQLLVWNFTKSIIFFSISIISLIPLAFLVIKQCKRIPCGTFGRHEGSSWDEGKTKFTPTFVWDSKGEINFMIMPFGLVVTIWLMLVAGACADLTWLKIWIAPKLYLIEYAASLIK